MIRHESKHGKEENIREEKYMNKRKLYLILTVIISVLLYTGCKKAPASDPSSVLEDVSPTVTVENGNDKEQIAEGEKFAEQYHGFVETPMDLGGRKIRFKSALSHYYVYADNPDDTSNETLAVIEAIKSIEKDYNCEIIVEPAARYDDLEAALITAKASGDTYCDIYEGMPYSHFDAANVYAYDVILPLDDPSISDIIKWDTNPWLPASELGYLYGHQYGAHFLRANNGDVIRSVFVFNKELAEQYDLGNIYELVRNNEWTFDKFEEICAQIVSRSDGTIIPFTSGLEQIIIPQLVLGNNGTFAESDGLGYNFTGMSDNTLEALNYAYNLVNKGYFKYTGTDFYDSKAVFYATIYNEVKHFVQGVGNLPFEAGIVPGPMGPKADDYCTTTYSAAMYHVMKGIEKPEEVAAVLVALANRLTLAKEQAVVYQSMYGIPDKDSIEMFEIMFDNYKVDISRIGAGNMLMDANNSILALEKTPREAYEEISPMIQARYDEIKNATPKDLEERFSNRNIDYVQTPVEGILAHFTFDDEETGFISGDIVAEASGKIELSDDAHKGNSLVLDGTGSNYLKIVDANGNNPLIGMEEFSIILSSKTNNVANWALFLTPNDEPQVYLEEKYLGILDNGQRVIAERYNNSGARPSIVDLPSVSHGWKQILLVFKEDSYYVYNTYGHIGKVESEYKLSDIIGDNGIFYVGKANWGNGEFFTGLLDEMVIYNHAFTEAQIKNFTGLTELP